MDTSKGLNNRRKNTVKIERPAILNHQDEHIWDEIRKFARMIHEEPDPNMGRVREIKEEIKNGTYLTPEIIDETAARLVSRLYRKMT